MPASPNAARLGIREFIADRENLTAGARQQFFRALDEFEAFQPKARHANWGFLLLLSLCLCLVCGFLDADVSKWRLLTWPGYYFVSLVLVMNIRRHELAMKAVNLEVEWRAYCLFLRPLVLARFPGLLDRNLDSLAPLPDRTIPRHRSLLREIFILRGLDFWLSALVGTWCSMALLLTLRQILADPSRWLPLILVAAGIIGGPLIWSAAQLVVYRLAQPNVADG